MGGCGCGDGFGDFRFPAPDGGWYAVQLYYGCKECDTPYGVILHHYKPNSDCPITNLCDEKQWMEQEDYATTQLTILHPQHLKATLGAALNGLAEEIKNGDWDEVPPADLAAELIDEALPEAVSRSSDADW